MALTKCVILTSAWSSICLSLSFCLSICSYLRHRRDGYNLLIPKTITLEINLRTKSIGGKVDVINHKSLAFHKQNMEHLLCTRHWDRLGAWDTWQRKPVWSLLGCYLQFIWRTTNCPVNCLVVSVISINCCERLLSRPSLRLRSASQSQTAPERIHHHVLSILPPLSSLGWIRFSPSLLSATPCAKLLAGLSPIASQQPSSRPTWSYLL